MPVVYQHRVFRRDLQSNRDVLYLFGDNERRSGLGGQAREMRGEPNAVGVRTKRAPDTNPDSYWTDDEYEANCSMIDDDMRRPLEHLVDGGVVVVPADGLGTGLSRMEELCPRTFEYLEWWLERLEDAH